MSRPIRTVLLIAVFGLVGVIALTWIARRYADIGPTKSVNDLRPSGPAAPAPEPAPETAAPGKPVTAEKSPPAIPSEKAVKEVDQFLAVRAALKPICEQHAFAVRQLADQAKNPPKKDSRFNKQLFFLAEYRVRRHDKLAEVGMTWERYAAVRSLWRSWSDGKGADPSYTAAFDARKDDASGASLGDGEFLDDQMVGS